MTEDEFLELIKPLGLEITPKSDGIVRTVRFPEHRVVNGHVVNHVASIIDLENGSFTVHYESPRPNPGKPRKRYDASTKCTSFEECLGVLARSWGLISGSDPGHGHTHLTVFDL